MIRPLERHELPECVCDDLMPVIEALEAEHGFRVVKADFDIKSSMIDVYLDRAIPAPLLAELEKRFKKHADVGFEDGLVVCRTHFQCAYHDPSLR